MFRAIAQETTVGAYLWVEHGDVAYSHLGCSSPLGYRFGASYALVWSAIEYYAGRVGWINLMGNAGARADHADSLSFFKRGWAQHTRTAYLCGRIFDRERYKQISHRMGVSADGYFPAYRKGEFA